MKTFVINTINVGNGAKGVYVVIAEDIIDAEEFLLDATSNLSIINSTPCGEGFVSCVSGDL